MNNNQMAQRVLDACLDIGRARHKLRTLSYEEGVNKLYLQEKANELNVVQAELEQQVKELDKR